MRVIIWGAGEGGEEFINTIGSKDTVVAFIDNDIEKQNKEYNGVMVYSSNYLKEISKEDYDFILIATKSSSSSIVKELTGTYGIDNKNIIYLYPSSGTDIRVNTLELLSKQIEEKNIKGEVAELGVLKGDFAKEINKFFPKRKLYLFDTFSGFDKRDIDVEAKEVFSTAKENDLCNEDIELVLGKMKYRENCIVKKGYFPETAENIEETFALVSIDVDLYQPIKEGLNYFYDRLSVGGYIMVHDYYNKGFLGAKKATDEFCQERGLSITPVMETVASCIICKHR